MNFMSTSHITNLFSVEGKVALVTGGSRGIGLMIARAFVENGVKVYISSRKAEVCDQVAQELSEFGTCISLPADLSTNEGRSSLIAGLQERESRLDILINNAGAAWGAPFEEHPESAYDKVMDLNVKSVFYLTQGLMPMLKEASSLEDPARIVNIGSIDGLRQSVMDNVPYGMSKVAVHHLTRMLATKFDGYGITINAIAPGLFPSKMTKWTMDNFQEQIEKMNPLRRVGQPDDMGGIAIFLCSRAGSYLNGAVIPVDGGLHLLSKF